MGDKIKPQRVCGYWAKEAAKNTAVARAPNHRERQGSKVKKDHGGFKTKFKKRTTQTMWSKVKHKIENYVTAKFVEYKYFLMCLILLVYMNA